MSADTVTNYKDLQTKAKKHGIKANLGADELTRLLDRAEKGKKIDASFYTKEKRMNMKTKAAIITMPILIIGAVLLWLLLG
ncbi:hypothetical protein F-M6_0250 [Faustovirus]|nr:hypothetical protein F-LCD7_0248 [Faustovirus]QJX72013.1 hypothetical protein F-M6_0250 [Faustovirus]QJX74017.1 hypothetical protein F-E9_263 [Faustovirus]